MSAVGWQLCIGIVVLATVLVVVTGFAFCLCRIARLSDDRAAELYDREADGWLLDRACHDLRIDELLAEDERARGRRPW